MRIGCRKKQRPERRGVRGKSELELHSEERVAGDNSEEVLQQKHLGP